MNLQTKEIQEMSPSDYLRFFDKFKINSVYVQKQMFTRIIKLVWKIGVFTLVYVGSNSISIRFI